MATLLNLIQNDFGYTLNFTLQDSTGVAVNLSGVTVLSFKAQLDSDPSVQVNGAMTVVSAPAGTCKYVVAQADFAVSGTYNAQIQATYGSAEVLSWGDITLSVANEVPA